MAGQPQPTAQRYHHACHPMHQHANRALVTLPSLFGVADEWRVGGAAKRVFGPPAKLLRQGAQNPRRPPIDRVGLAIAPFSAGGENWPKIRGAAQ
jgi:hypothetical protein